MSIRQAPGGLASGMRSYVEKIKNQNDSEMEICWVGWPGASVKQADQERVKKEIAKKLRNTMHIPLRRIN